MACGRRVEATEKSSAVSGCLVPAEGTSLTPSLPGEKEEEGRSGGSPGSGDNL